MGLTLRGFDFRDPDYEAVWNERQARLAWIRRDDGKAGERVRSLRKHYAEGGDGLADFIEDWGVTFDPRNIEIGRPALVPFVLFAKQREWICWLVDHWLSRRSGLTEKSRDSGVSWLSIAAGCGLCLHHRGMVVGYGSRKSEYVDKTNEPKSLFFKARLFLQELPAEFRNGWDALRHAPHMRLVFPNTGSTMTGEGGDNIGRGDRAGIYFVDEAAFLPQPYQVDAALSQTTNCRMYVSTPNRPGDLFEQKRFSGKIDVFTFHWREDPRKDEAWYAKQLEDLDPVIVAREIDIDYSASVTGIVIPKPWIMAAVDAHDRLGVKPTGQRAGALDVADEGPDLNAFCVTRGVLVEHLEEWSGKGSDIFATVERAHSVCDRFAVKRYRYDADGLGADVRGDARVINEARVKGKVPAVEVEPFRGSGGVLDPEREDVPGRKNEDYFKNRKAQGWWRLRRRFMLTHRWVKESIPCPPDDIISLPSTLPYLTKLVTELGRPTYETDAVGKLLINKAPDGVPSPNLGDVVMIRFAGGSGAPIAIPADALARSRAGILRPRR